MKIHYHSDHLGSASFVTDIGGNAVQHLQYLPYGELFVSQRKSKEFDSRYKFTAKELDNETSYTYFGARYYDSELSGWLSVDPMSDKYPSLSPYCYTADNPVVLVDPNLMELNTYDDPPPKVITNNKEAIKHYYNGNGEPVKIGENITNELLNTKEFKEYHNKIISGNASTPGNFGINMENKKDAFFIGNTRVDYDITTSKDNKTCTVTYTIYTNDGFWDPNYIKENMGNKMASDINLTLLSAKEIFGIDIGYINTEKFKPDGM
ncbi:MAG TPA: RHS repeat-associated core domain-containing protein [Bacteroidales bacterium]|jgi:RHS repeat-associated protein|nr:RHS repeat-associated core domain-containing protein [Bacteroidales bacterium]MDY0400910.1 RHS repeat-associated core domain-containing protein [Bacteroidales bacterium]HQD59172.1 RHS repeat-associated core domain-containing protein [Bacteroidales bacterium]